MAEELDRLRGAIEDRLSWTPYEDVQRHRAEAVEAGVAVAAELLWLHAEAVWMAHQAELEIARVNRAWRDVVVQWERGHQNDVLPYTAALEGEIAAQRAELADLKAESENRLEVGDRLGWRLVEAEAEIGRLRREVEFEANGERYDHDRDTMRCPDPNCPREFGGLTRFKDREAHVAVEHPDLLDVDYEERHRECATAGGVCIHHVSSAVLPEGEAP